MPAPIARTCDAFRIPRVEECDGARRLIVGPAGFQTVTPLISSRLYGVPHTGLYYDWAELVPILRCRNVLILGLGGGEMARVIHAVRPGTLITAVENDERVIQLARTHFPENLKGVEVIVGDAWEFVESTRAERYDAVIVDVFDGMDIPERFYSTEFFSSASRCLSSWGAVIMNVAPVSLVQQVGASMRLAGLESIIAFPVVTELQDTGSTIVYSKLVSVPSEVIPSHLKLGWSRRWTL